MKKIVTVFSGSRQRLLVLALGASLGLGACEVTDLQPVDALSETAVFTTPERVALAVTGVYNAAQSGFYDPLNGGALAIRGYPFGAASAALNDARGEDVTDMLGFFGIVFSNTVNPSSPNVVNMWSTCYALINQANTTIEGVRLAARNNVITATEAATYEGELRFLRALAHHELVLHFSRPFSDNNGTSPGVPYRDFAINNPDAITKGRAIGRGTVAEVYTKILADLDFAEKNLPTTRTIANAAFPSVTRVTRGAAIAITQRVRLHQGNFAAVVTEGNKLITGTTTFTSPIGGYVLMASQRAAFPGGAAATAENIFSVENRSDDNPGVNGALPNVFGTTDVPVRGRTLIGVSPILFNAPFFTCADLRRTEMMRANSSTPAAYVITKYTDATTSSDYNPIVRYAEVLLNQAEALARTGNDALALSLLNAVRNRSVTTPADRFAPGSLTATGLVRAILNERRIEFVGEGKRWGDLSRLAADPAHAPIPGGGIPAKFWGQQGTSQVSIARYGCNRPDLLVTPLPFVSAVPANGANATQFLWPIPALEIANNATLKDQQNPGY